ncbi:hypothetical protein LCGC14_2531750, partial [marine sediment metagenome]
RQTTTFLRGKKERPARVLAKLVAKHAEAAGGIAKAKRSLFGAQAIDVESPQGFVLSVGGVGGREEEARHLGYAFIWTVRHSATISSSAPFVKHNLWEKIQKVKIAPIVAK